MLEALDMVGQISFARYWLSWIYGFDRSSDLFMQKSRVMPSSSRGRRHTDQGAIWGIGQHHDRAVPGDIDIPDSALALQVSGLSRDASPG